MALTDPLTLGRRTAPNRLMFGPIVTNLGDDLRRFTPRHTAFYARRAVGGCGLIVTEEASVHAWDWPYERSPLAERCHAGWSEIAAACHAHGALVIAGLGHAGGQGSSAYSQRELWAPSRVPEVNAREVPKWMEPEDIAVVGAGFADAARTAVGAGCDGVEINAGQHSLIRQFLSGLTNHRGDEWGDRTRFALDVIEAVRAAVGAESVVGLRLSCDELAPWAGVTPEQAVELSTRLTASGIDYLVVVRGSIFSVEKTRPDFHEPTGFNIDLCRTVRAAVSVPVYLQGSVVDVGQAEWALADGVCDGVEMTRAQLADPDLFRKLADGVPDRIRPCIRCNQTCQVRDGRNPIITCVVEPTTGREAQDPDWFTPSPRPREVVVVGGGIAGLETARVAAGRGHHPVRLLEQSAEFGGVARIAGPGGPFLDWLVAECRIAGVDLSPETAFVPAVDLTVAVVQCTGSRAGSRPYEQLDGAHVVDIFAVRARPSVLPADGVIALFDPIGGPIAVALAEELGDRAVLITQDNIAGNELSRTGDLAPANVRLQQRGVRIERRAVLRTAGSGWVELEDRFSGARRRIECAALVDCGFRLPTEPLDGVALSAGDCVAPRTILEAVLEGRRAALAIDQFPS